MKTNYEIALKETKIAYTESTQNLRFKSSVSVNREEAIKIAKSAIVEYNEFTPELLLHLPEDSQITFAREYSVCIYVQTPTKFKLSKKLLHDEANYNNGILRLWWD